MTFFKMTQTCSRIVAALSISMLLVACGGGSSSTPGVTSLLITLTAPTASTSAATGTIGTNSQGAWQGSFTAGTSSALFTNISNSSDPIASATVASSNSPTTAILTLAVDSTGYVFGPSGSITQNQYDTLKAAGTTLIVRIVTNNTNTVYTAALTQS